MIYNDNFNIMITGAGGFLGNELLNQLSKNPKYKIIALTSKEDKIYRRFSNNKSITCYNLYDINNKSIPWSDIDMIIHCAFARSYEGHSLANSLDFTTSLLLKAKNEGVKGFINISSQSVYGGHSNPLWRESLQVSPDSTYAMAKYATEIIIKIICEDSQMKYTNLRLSSLVGPELDVRLVSKFVNNAINSKPIQIIGGKQILSFMHVKDAAEGLFALINIEKSIWKNTYNFGSTNRHTILEIAEIVKRIAPEYTSNPVSIEIEEKDVHIDSGMDSSLFYNDTGWKPKYDMDAIVRSLFEYFTNF
jgi:nucleoside-diphosphate-sugar epimerase